MIIVIINKTGIRHTLVDVGSMLNVCSIELLPKINIDLSSLNTSSVDIHGFDNVGRQALGTIVLPLRLGPVTVPTLVYVMEKKLPYNLLLGKLWIHVMGAVSSTLHKSIKFICNNKVVIVKVDLDVICLCEMATISQASLVPTLIPLVSSTASIFTPVVTTTKDTLEINVPEEDPSKARNPKPTSSQRNACVGDDWGPLDFTNSFI